MSDLCAQCSHPHLNRTYVMAGNTPLWFCSTTCCNRWLVHDKSDGKKLHLLVLAACIFTGVTFKAWGAPPENASGAYSSWFTSQLQEDNLPTPCCGDEASNGGDGHFVNVRYVGHDKELGDRYEVQIGDQWLLYPRVVPSALQNPTGRNVAWYVTNSDGSIYWYCLRIALGV